MCSAMSWRRSRRKKRRIREVEAKASNVAPEHKSTPWESMNDHNMRVSKQSLGQGLVERNAGTNLGLEFQQIAFKDLLGGVSPSLRGVSPPPKASGSASSSSAAAPTAAASTATARAVVQAQKPKFKPPPPPRPRGDPVLSREPLQARCFTFGLQRLALVYKNESIAKRLRETVIASAGAPVPGGHAAVSGP